MTTTIVAVCAILVSLYSIYAKIRHDKLSVRPHLIRHSHRDRRENGILVFFEIANHGIGPARIKKMDFFLEGKPFTAEFDIVEALIKASLDGKAFYEIAMQGCPGKDYYLLPSQTYRLAEIFFPGAKQADEIGLNNHFKSTHYRIEYESLYGEQFVLDTRDSQK